MSDFMFGERYFATREQLFEVMNGITQLVADTATEIDVGGLSPTSQPDSLETPFSILVCGEVNAGKSTFINGLCGQDICSAGVLPETRDLIDYRYASLASTKRVTTIEVDQYHPLDFLRNFHLTDTPGTQMLVPGQRECILRRMATADLVFFIFSISDPWCPTTWDWISSLPITSHGKAAILIQQADQREPNDVEVILGHVADLSMKRLGFRPPIFAVSGRNAYEATRLGSSPEAKKLRAASGYAALDVFISQQIYQSPSRRMNLEAWRNHAASMLQTVEDRIEELNRGIQSQSRFIDEIESEIDDIRSRFVERLPNHLVGMARVFEEEAHWVSKQLRQRLGASRSLLRLFSGDRTGPEIEAIFIERLRAAVEVVAEEDGNKVMDVCLGHWSELELRVKTQMGVDLHAVAPIEETLEQARQRFINQLSNAAREGIGNLKVRNQLDKELRRRNVALKSFVSGSLIFTACGALSGIFGLPWVPAILCGIGGVFLTGGVLAAWVTRKMIARDFCFRLLDTCGVFANTLRLDYEEALRVVFRDYTVSLVSVRSHLANEKLSIEPKIKRWQELFLTLKAIELFEDWKSLP